MDGWFLTFDKGAGRPSVFAFVDDLTQDEIDTLHVLLSEEIAGVGASYETFSSDFLLKEDRAMLIRFRREWREIDYNLKDPTQSDGELMYEPWYDFYYLYQEFRREVISLREFDEDAADEGADEEECPPAGQEPDAIVDLVVEENPELLRTERSEATIPNWDSNLMTLFWGKQIARRVSNNAKNVVAILNAFQEEMWPFKIDDPLPGGRNPERLRDTLKQLNKDLKHLRFSADGSGEGIIWTKGETGETTPPA